MHSAYFQRGRPCRREVEFVSEPLDDTPEGQLIRFVHGYAAKVEHDKIKERTMRGRRARIQTGKPPVGVRPPYGYRWVEEPGPDGKPVKVRLEEHPETAPVVRRIFAEIAAGSSARPVAQAADCRRGADTDRRSAVWGTRHTVILRHPPIPAT